MEDKFVLIKLKKEKLLRQEFEHFIIEDIKDYYIFKLYNLKSILDIHGFCLDNGFNTRDYR
jgi:hypothetical protein